MGQTLYDGFVSLHQGMDAATPADYDSMQYRSAMAVNVSHRGGYPHQRPAYIKRDLDFQGVADTEGWFQDDMFQGASVYYPDSGDPVLIASVGGRMFTIEIGAGYRVNNVTKPSGADNSWLPKAWFTQVEKWMVKQNGIDQPVIFDGASCRNPASDEIKTGTCGVYAWGRYWYSLPNGIEYRAGDIVFGNGNREDVLFEKENTFLNGGGNFSVPGGAGKIRAILSPAVMDNALGQGPIQVFCDTAIFSCNAPVDRDVWQDLTYPIQTVTLNNNGAMSDISTIIVNSDVFYRSIDGFRSQILARREFGNWGNTPISREVEVFYKNDNQELLQYCTGAVWNNRALFGVMPKLINGLGVIHSGLVVMDFDLISTLKAKEPPAWDGLWTGLQIHQLVNVKFNNKERLFAFVRSTTDDHLELWEVCEDKKIDNGTVPIEWVVMLRKMNFGDRWKIKKLQSGELFVKDMDGSVEFDIDYRPDDYECAVDWAAFTECATTDICSEEECIVPVNRHPQYRTAMQLPTPQDECNEIEGTNMRFGYKFQPIIRVRGAAKLGAMRIEATSEIEVKEVKCGVADCKVLECCPIDPLTHSAEEEPRT